MPMPNDRVVLDISFANFEYAINSCLERCQSVEDCKRLTGEIFRIMKIRQRKEQVYRKKVNAVAIARTKRWA